MDIFIVCGSSDPGAGERVLGVVLGLVVVAAMWTHHRRLAKRPARQILPIK